MFALLRRFGLDGFILALLASALFAAVWPELGRSGGLLHLDWYASWGVAVVFLLYGLGLSPARMRAGLLNWRLHCVVQGATFILFPLLGLLLDATLGSLFAAPLALGLFYLCALPSTVSSSVTMTSIAHGNVPGAIFNASLSSLIGVFITPLWVNAYLQTQGAGLPLGPVIGKIVLMVVVPIVLGQLLRPLLLRQLERAAPVTRWLDRATIVAIVANSFADSVHEGVWAQQGILTLLAIAAIAVVLFWGVMGLLALLCDRLGFSREDRIAAQFCGSKKSLAAGVPMAGIMFAGNPALGLIIAPIMIFHLLQLVMVSVLARRWGQQHSG
ncbi:bile acid:sodium symporter family protein [Uliginosibacterium aquaticum]|uniref:Bile acid:sodium symporter n=1 Tax=Uliginosibacterium aquaticum TaxID=2731212 RepID=A0ABX2IPN5_9RHOO|nr:bile acid:sodium symporter family protein [Uliginosibacterium aquaticum]NSL56982.1 bile acid:sodium symporter [Uliginosibacterium aquaticum]